MKVGDKVIAVVDCKHGDFKKGNEGILTGIDINILSYYIDFGQGEKSAYSREFKLIKTKDMDFKKEDLKTGMRITTESGSKYFIFRDCPTAYTPVEDFWANPSGSSWDKLDTICMSNVNKVEIPAHPFDMVNVKQYRLLWERKPEVTELTIEEIAKKFGLNTENIRIKD